MSPDHTGILDDARQRAALLLQNLLHHQADLSAPRSAISLQSLAAGQEALRETVDSAARLLESIEQAHTQHPDTNEPE